MTASKTCEHDPCDCKAAEDSNFCSKACEKAHANGDTECPCPHDHCGGHDHT